MDRYERNIAIEGFGEEGQARLAASRVLVIGVGGLGSPVLYYLAAAGVGALGVMDDDVVNISNLQRQILHSTADVGRPKTASANEKLTALNPQTRITVFDGRFIPENAAEIVSDWDFVVDCCDNFETKFLINDICVAAGKPYSHGAVSEFRGEVMTWIPGAADLRAVFPEVPSQRSPRGILGAIAGTIGAIQATETIKFLTGTGELITDRILIFDGRKMTFTSLEIG